MKDISELRGEAENEIFKEKEQVMKEVIKEHMIEILKIKEEIEDAQRRYQEADKKYNELLDNKNLLLSLCLKRIVLNPIKQKD